MARLGRDSPEELYEPSDDSPIRRGVRNRTRTSKKGSATSSPDPHKLSPRKTAAISRHDRDGSSSDTETEQQMQPRKPFGSSRRPRQIKLAPLNSASLKSYISDPKLEDDAEKPLKSLRTTQVIRPRTEERSPRKLNDLARLEDAEQRMKSLRVSHEQIEESSCSEDDLPSVQEVLHLRKSTAHLQKHNPKQFHDLLEELNDLSISDESKPQSKVTSIDDDEGNSFPASRPGTASEKEDPSAILRFSPPRLYSPSKPSSDKQLVTPPHSPPKSRLNSPSKWRNRIPTPPFRQSLDAFWNSNTVNDWNDNHSPEKPLRSPKKMHGVKDKENTSPTSSPRKIQSPTKRSKAAVEARNRWDARKQEIAQNFLLDLDNCVAGGKIGLLTVSTGGVKIIWSKTLNKTAGRAHWRHESSKGTGADGLAETTHHHHAKIELAQKVIDNEDRLLNVMAHEFCHLCNFMISGIKDQPHGRQFKVWGRKCTQAFAHRGVTVTTKHSYEIEYKFVWRCVNEDCGATFQRHSKSVNPNIQRCGRCKGQILQIKPTPRKDASENIGDYAAFVKAHFANVRREMGGADHKEVMAALGQRYKDHKLLGADQQAREACSELNPALKELGSAKFDL